MTDDVIETVRVAGARERMLFLAEVEDSPEAYAMPLVLRIVGGRLDVEGFAAAFRDVVARHPSLRTAFDKTDDGWVESVRDAADAPVLNRSGESWDGRLPLAPDPRHEVPAGAAVYAEHVVIVVHHVAADGQSMPAILDDLEHAYAHRVDGRAPVWPTTAGGGAEPPRASASGLAPLFADMPTAIPLPLDRPRSPSPSSAAVRQERLVPPWVARALSEASGRVGVSRLMLLHAAVALALRSKGAGDRIPLGMVADLRDDADAGVGLFLNTIVGLTDLTGATTVGEVIGRARDCALDAWERRTVPFDELVAEVAPARATGVHPLFQVMIAEVDRRTRAVALGDVAAEIRHDAEPTAKFDLTFAIGDGDEGLVVDVVSRAELFTAETTSALLESVVLALVAVTGDAGAPADGLALARSVGGRAALQPPSTAVTQRRVALPRHHVAAALVGVYVSSDSVGTRRAGEEYVPLTLDEILDAAEVTAESRRPDTAAGRPITASEVPGGVLLTAASEVIDEESWPALLQAISVGSGRGIHAAAEYTGALSRRADDLEIVDAAERWLDVIESAPASAADPAWAALDTGASAHAELPAPPATVTALRAAVLSGFADVGLGPGVAMISEPDRDDPAHASAVGVRRRDFPVFFLGDGTIVQPTADAARDYAIAGGTSRHTPGVFDGLVSADAHIDVHVSDLPVAPAEGRVAVTASIVDGRWRVTVSGHRDAAAIATATARRVAPADAPSALTAIVRPAEVRVQDTVGIGLAAIRDIERIVGPLRAVHPATALQEGLLFHRDLSGDGHVYLSQTITELSGTLDVVELQAAAARMIEQHPHVAGHFRRVGERTVLVVPRSPRIEWDLRTGDDRERFLSGQRERGFDGEGPLLRFGLLSSPDGSGHTWVLTVEHAILDGWSIWRFLRGILDEYTRRGSSVDRSGPPYAAYVSWLAARDREAARSAWGEALAGVEGATLVAPSESAGGRDDDGRSVERSLTLDPALTTRLRRVAAEGRAPLSAVYELAWALALRHETGRGDVVFGTVTSGRPPEIPGIDDLLGLLFNTVPVRARIRPGGDVRSHLDDLTRFRRVLLAHPEVPLSEILAGSGHRELFDTLFVFQNIPVTPPTERIGPDGGLRQRAQTVRDATHYPVTVVVNPGDDLAGARIRVMSRPGKWSSDAAAERATDRMVDAFVRALDGMSRHTGALAALEVRDPRDTAPDAVVGATPAEDEAVLLEATVWQLLVERARVDSDGLAVVAGPVRWTFADLVHRASRLAAALQEQGVGPESRVALYLPRDARMIVALFAVFAAHAAYVPIDPTLPESRVAAILRAAAPAVVVVDDARVAAVPAGAQVLSPDAVGEGLLAEPDRALDALAYVIFTSGSTGTPKGVAVPYRGLTNMFVNHRAEIFSPVVEAAGGRRLAIAHTTSFAFDASWEQLLWLLEGHSVHVIDDDMRRDPHALLSYFDDNRIDGFDVTPSYGGILVDEGLLARERCTDPTADGAGVVFVSLGGEAVPDDLWAALREAPGVRGYNLYGPTEYTINALGADVDERSTSTIGRPITGTVARVLDDALRPVRPGVAGELYLSGVGLARGYLGRSDLTAERFVADPFGMPGQRMYRTGDLATIGDDGLISYLGRSDDQVKIRGHRVEPAEISSALVALDGIRRAAVVPLRGVRGTELAAYVVAEVADHPPRAADVTSALRSRLPDYLVPATVTVVDELPLTVNGKLDVRALPQPVREPVERRRPVGDVEYLIAEAIAEVLGIDEVGRDDDFFLLGGHSLLAVRVVSRLRSSSGLDLSVRDLYGAPTVAGLARAAAGERNETMFAPVLRLRDADGPAVFCLQPAGGLGWAYAGLCRHLDPAYAVYALQDPALSGGPALTSMDAIVDDQIARIRAVRPHGPYHLLGWSFGGQLAHAIATRLDEVASVVLLDAYADGGDDEIEAPVDEQVAGFVRSIADDPVLGDLDAEARERLVATFERHLRLSMPALTGSVDVDTLLVAATRGIDTDTATRRDAGWRSRIAGRLDVEPVDLDHGGLGRAANWEIFGGLVARWIEGER
jgi:amino acid adenylation domain-containing protein